LDGSPARIAFIGPCFVGLLRSRSWRSSDACDRLDAIKKLARRPNNCVPDGQDVRREKGCVNRCHLAKDFVLLPRRWVVERTLAWLNRNRRLAKDFEATTESAVTWLFIASVKLMSRRLAVA
jgi:transposase